MKRPLLIGFLLGVSGIAAPVARAQYCGDALDEDAYSAAQALEELGVYQDVYDNTQIWIPVSFHMIRRSDGSGGPTNTAINLAMTNLNNAYNTHGIYFVRMYPDWFIDSDTYWSCAACYWQTIAAINPIPGTINIVIEPPSGVGCLGAATFTFDTSNYQVVRITQDCLASTEPGILAHEVGHYMNLWHTFERTANGVSCPGDTVTCNMRGDNVCDTPADLQSTSYIVSCTYTNPGVEFESGCSQAYSNMPITNVMSYHPGYCLTTTTAGQSVRVRAAYSLRQTGDLGRQSPLTVYTATPGWINSGLVGKTCWANCDGSTSSPILNVSDFSCFQAAYAAASGLSNAQQIISYANCDGSTASPAVNTNDFTCFLNRYASGCP